MLSRSLFVILYFVFWPLCCLFFFDMRILITPWYLKTLPLTITSPTCSNQNNGSPSLFGVTYFCSGLPAVITMAAYFPDITTDDVPYPVALNMLGDAGATVVGLNCDRVPWTMLPLLQEVRKVCKVSKLVILYNCMLLIHVQM